jgi:hypothetical protein
MSEERDTQVEHLRPGDQVRYLGEWFDVVKVRAGIGRRGAYVAIEVDELAVQPSGALQRRVFMWLFGTFVAAECNPRIEGTAASAAELYSGAA